MRILFIGCVESSRQLLESLVESSVNIVGVVTKEESLGNADFINLKPICEKHGIDYYYVKNINDPDSLDYIRAKKPDVIYCFGWSQLISKAIIEIPEKGVIGFHPAELPYNRGRHPIIWALVLGLRRTASTFFYITEGADEGDIISQEIITIDEDEDARTLYDKIMVIANRQVKELTMQLLTDSIHPIPQDNDKANYWRKRSKKDGEIDWRMSAQSINRLIKALTHPYVGAHFTCEEREYRIWSSSVIVDDSYINMEHGKVLKVYSDHSYIVKTGDGCLLVEECDSINLREGDYLL